LVLFLLPGTAREPFSVYPLKGGVFFSVSRDSDRFAPFFSPNFLLSSVNPESFATKSPFFAPNFFPPSPFCAGLSSLQCYSPSLRLSFPSKPSLSGLVPGLLFAINTAHTHLFLSLLSTSWTSFSCFYSLFFLDKPFSPHDTFFFPRTWLFCNFFRHDIPPYAVVQLSYLCLLNLSPFFFEAKFTPPSFSLPPHPPARFFFSMFARLPFSTLAVSELPFWGRCLSSERFFPSQRCAPYNSAAWGGYSVSLKVVRREFCMKGSFSFPYFLPNRFC